MSNITLGPPRSLDGPRPIPPRYGLLASAGGGGVTLEDDFDPHAMAGGQVWPYPRLDDDIDETDGAVHDPCASGTEAGVTKIDGGADALPEFAAFTAYVAETCSALSVGDADEPFRERALAGLNGLESALVEHEFATGTVMPLNPYLANANAELLNGGAATTPINGLALLEEAIAETGKMGVIHASPGTVTAWAGFYLVTKEGSFLKTAAAGTPVVVGYGYREVDPDSGAASAADQGWAWATGPVQIRRSEPILIPGTLREALDRAQNLVTYRAERHYLVDWDTQLQAAVLVDRVA